ncbi:DUF3261 domain-containing protein [Halomonas nitroreducens]|uniref:DUF3261 domain-containing protein n=1 Tax=Halomonas nitroreducens TaxID=447425 RepID=A0A3S0K6B7_9GAMM|nr:DUF3261 domain-containing protein [Halomonas nitroreducens]RTR07119.1 DUF3261 domain-containing protein [Halomonas nitroreducens]
MRAPASRLAVLLLTLQLAGCAALRPAPPPAPGLAAMPTLGPVQRRLTLAPDADPQQARTLITVLSLEPERLRAVLLTPYGQRLATLVRDARGSRYESGDTPVPGEAPLPVPADWLAARLEWCLWPLEALHQAFAGSAWSAQRVGDSREIRRGGALVARIRPADPELSGTRRVLLDDRQGEYRLTIAPLKEAPP